MHVFHNIAVRCIAYEINLYACITSCTYLCVLWVASVRSNMMWKDNSDIIATSGTRYKALGFRGLGFGVQGLGFRV